jgi:RNA polymerase sigma-32 factor
MLHDSAPSMHNSEWGLARYLQQARRFSVPSSQEGNRARHTMGRTLGPRNAGDWLVTSHLQLVVSVAAGYSGYGLRSRVSIPTRGFRLATYAIWWIRASIQEYVRASPLRKRSNDA